MNIPSFYYYPSRFLLSLGWVLLIFGISKESAIAQKKLVYDSLYQLPGFMEGKAQFEYDIRDGKIEINGYFKFQGETKDSLNPTHKEFLSCSGNYENGKKEGEWFYDYQKTTAKIEDLNRRTLKYSLKSIDEKIRISYKQGFPEGKCSIETAELKDGQVIKEITRMNCSFLEHRIHGSFSYSSINTKGEGVRINGDTEKGFLTGTWAFDYSSDQIWEERRYDKGILLSLSQLKEGDTLINLEFPLSENLREELAGGAPKFQLVNHPLSLTFSDGYPGSSKWILKQGRGNDYLEEAVQNIFKYDEDIKYDFGLPLGTSRGIYNLTKEEAEALAQWPDEYSRLEGQIGKFRELDIKRLEFLNDSIFRRANLWVERQYPILEKISRWYQIVGSDQLVYYNRTGLLADHAKNTLEFDNIFLNGRNTLVRYSCEPPVDCDNFLGYVTNNLTKRRLYGDSLHTLARHELEAYQYSKQLFELNERIKKEQHLEDSLFSILPKDPNLIRLLSSTNDHFFQNTFKDQYELFQSSDIVAEQLRTGNQIVAEIRTLEKIHDRALEIEENLEDLDSIYTEYLFDPFTYTDRVPSRVKKKLYDAVVFEIIPQYILLKAQNHFEVAERVLKDLEKIIQIQERMKALRFQDTSKLERKIRQNKELKYRIEYLLDE